MKFNGHKYTLTLAPGGYARHIWQVIGPKGGVHFTANFYKEGEPPSCGLEFHHSREGRTDYQLGVAPSQSPCWLLGEPCWHDGTSSYANDNLWPMFSGWLQNGAHEDIFRSLEREYKSRFERKEDEQ
jgi:hypothetical protein